MNQNTAKTMRALASPSRIKIIQALLERQKTLTELSYELNLHKSTVKNHLLKLETAALISYIDSTNNYKYYKLTKVGHEVCNNSKNILDILSIITVICVNLTFISKALNSSIRSTSFSQIYFYVGLIIFNVVFLVFLARKKFGKKK